MRVTVNEGLGEIKEWKTITLWIKPFNSSIEFPHSIPVREFTKWVTPLLDARDGIHKFIIRIERPGKIADYTNNQMLDVNIASNIRVGKEEYEEVCNFLARRAQAEEHMIEDEFRPQIIRRLITNAIMELEI